MSDTHEEQLLSHWLRDIARQDERLRADHLEARVMSAVPPTQETMDGIVRLKPDTTYMRAAAIVIAALFPAVLWMKSAPAGETVRRAAKPPSVVVPETVQEPAVDARAHTPVRTRITPPMRTARRTAPTNPTRPTHPTNATHPTNPSDEFVPLMPMTPQELTGPFQIVRVQMPRASLGALRSPLDHPSELVEADVLLGEDGMARAIRVSTGGSIYPWRSR